MFEIIKNAEIPVNARRKVPPKYPFAQMEVGDGFDAPRDMGKFENGQDIRQNNISNCASYYVSSRNPTAKFTVRILDENAIRCVRTA